MPRSRLNFRAGALPDRRTGPTSAGSALTAFAAVLLLGAAQAACAVGPNYHTPDQPPVALTALPPTVSVQPAAGADWWSAFGDPELDSLIHRGLAANLDLRVALDRVQGARALFRESQLNFLPHITTDGGYGRSKEQVPGFGTQRVDIEQADLGFDAAWEIDLFGHVRRSVEAAHADSQAAAEDLRDTQVMVAAEIARNYIALRGAQAREAVAQQNAQTASDTVHLTEVRGEIGSGDPVDTESARAQLQSAEAQIPVLRAQEAQAANRLAVLIGVRPGALDAELVGQPPAAPLAQPAQTPIGDASTFLRRRPDVRAAERRLAAETARTGVATADLFPRVNVTGFVGFLSGDVASLFRNGSQAWSISPAVTWPGLDIASAAARLRAQKAVNDESLATYQQTVLRAVEDLQDALVNYREHQAEVLSLAQQVDAARRAADLAHIRYKEGRIDFLRVLDAERTRLEAEDALTEAQTEANLDVVAIYRALGGETVA